MSRRPGTDRPVPDSAGCLALPASSCHDNSGRRHPIDGPDPAQVDAGGKLPSDLIAPVPGDGGFPGRQGPAVQAPDHAPGSVVDFECGHRRNRQHALDRQPARTGVRHGRELKPARTESAIAHPRGQADVRWSAVGATSLVDAATRRAVRTAVNLARHVQTTSSFPAWIRAAARGPAPPETGRGAVQLLDDQAGARRRAARSRRRARVRKAVRPLAERVGITLATLSILKTNKARAVRFSTLEALCRELECQPGDLLEYRPDEGP